LIEESRQHKTIFGVKWHGSTRSTAFYVQISKCSMEPQSATVGTHLIFLL